GFLELFKLVLTARYDRREAGETSDGKSKYWHVLLIPDVLECFSGTINYLHFQKYYLFEPFPIEKAPTQKITMENGLPDNWVTMSELLNYPVRALVF
ncbi:hypothetical protein C5167_042617, partial [Papaver somniferum]